MNIAGRFETGYIEFDNKEGTTGVKSGVLPDGVFVNSTRLEFCCRDDGFRDDEIINIPNDKPFILFSINEVSWGWCQEIAGREKSFYICTY